MKDQPIESKEKEEGGGEEEENPQVDMVDERTSTESSGQIRKNGVIAPLAALSLGWVVIYADRLSLSPLLNLIKGEFGLSYAAVSLVVSIYFLTYVSFTIPATILASRLGYKEGIVSFLFLADISFGLAGVFGYSYYLLLVLIALHGVGAGAYYPSAYAISSDLAPRTRRGFVSAIVNSGMGFGTILGLVVAGPILSFFSNWQAVLIVLSIPTAAVALLLFVNLPKVDEYHSKASINSKSNILVSYVRALRRHDFMKVCALEFCSLYGYWVILTWAPSYLQKTEGLNIFYSGAATAIFATVAIPSSLMVSKYSDKVGRRKVSLVLVPISAITIFAMVYYSTLWGFLIAVILYGVVGKLTLDPLIVAWVSDIMPAETIGPSLAILNVVAMSSSIIAPIVTGTIADFTGTLATGFYLGSAVVFFGVVFAISARSEGRASL